MEVPDVLEYPGEYGGSKAERGLPLRLLQNFFFFRKDYRIGYKGCQAHS